MLPVALLLLAAAQLLDYTSFLVMVARHGLDSELNPLAVLIAEQSGLLGLTAAKLFVVLFAGGTAALLVRRWRTLAGVVLGVGIAAGMIGALSNLISV